MVPQVEGVEIRPEGASVAFLLVHGFCAAPDEMRTLGQFLESFDIASFAVQLAGHGTTPKELKKTRWTDWYNSVNAGLELVKSWNPTHLFVAGFSMGGALSTILVPNTSGIDGLVLIAPALRIEGILPRFVPILKYFLRDREVDVIKVQEPYEIKRTKYSQEPVSAYHELFKLQKKARESLVNITIPTIIIQGTNDKTINPLNGKIAYNGISSQIKELHMIEGAEHVIPCHSTRTEAYAFIQEFVKRVISKPRI
ncbi:MAG: alpha/beta fold hydrolase [Candidatus Thorarchaeota archaeon]|nr:alpha/beta fold hydrolase [Candidatus Thorarchaeota archaeon]